MGGRPGANRGEWPPSARHVRGRERQAFSRSRHVNVFSPRASAQLTPIERLSWPPRHARTLAPATTCALHGSQGVVHAALAVGTVPKLCPTAMEGSGSRFPSSPRPFLFVRRRAPGRRAFFASPRIDSSRPCPATARVSTMPQEQRRNGAAACGVHSSSFLREANPPLLTSRDCRRSTIAAARRRRARDPPWPACRNSSRAPRLGSRRR